LIDHAPGAHQSTSPALFVPTGKIAL
jgi:hypothetical protein